MMMTMTLTKTLNQPRDLRLHTPMSRLLSSLRRDRPARRSDAALDETAWLWKLLVRIRPDRPPSRP
jgi:hypothetical protein